MEGELRALAQGAQQDQGQQDRVERVGAYLVSGSQYLIQVVAAHHMAEQHDPGQQAQAPGTGDHQRHVGAAAGIGAVVPVADQQEGEEAGELPEEHDLDQVAGNHQAEHGPHEGQEEGEETRHRILRRHVITRVERHQAADAQHQQREQPGEAVQAQHEVQPQARQPGILLANHPAIGDLWVQQSHLDGANECHQAGQQRFGVTCVVRQQGRQTAADEWQKQ